MAEERLLKTVDKYIVGIFVALVLLGWFNIYAAVFDENHASIFDLNQRYGKQMLFVVMSFVVAFIVMIIDIRFFIHFSYFFYGLSSLLLVLVLIIGSKISGATSWIQIGGFSLQPSEFAKFACCLAFAKFVSSPSVQMKRFTHQMAASAFFILPVILIMLQPDAGSALIFMAFILVMYREGMSGVVLVIGGVAVVLFVMALLLDVYVVLGIVAVVVLGVLLYSNKKFKSFLKAFLVFVICGVYIFGVDYAFHKLDSHQRTRINILLGLESDLHGAGYNVNQSKIAIGSGGVFGKGYLQGTQTKFNFVPEQSTDFIFCTVGEEWGLVGTTVVLSLFLILLIRIIQLAERQRTNFARVYGYSLASILFLHVAVNVGMTIGLLPVIGIPLPFLSYGGSSLWAFTLMLFVFLKMDAKRLA